MTDKEMQIIAQIDLFKLSAIIRSLNKLYERKEILKNSSVYIINFNGRITQSDNTSKQERLTEELDEINVLIDKYEKQANTYIKKMHDVKDGKILFYIYFRGFSYMKTSQKLNITKSAVFRRHNKALQNYFFKHLDK